MQPHCQLRRSAASDITYGGRRVVKHELFCITTKAEDVNKIRHSWRGCREKKSRSGLSRRIIPYCADRHTGRNKSEFAKDL